MGLELKYSHLVGCLRNCSMFSNLTDLNLLVSADKKRKLLIISFLLFIGVLLEVLSLALIPNVFSYVLNEESIFTNYFLKTSKFSDNQNFQIKITLLVILCLVFCIKSVFFLFLNYFSNNLTTRISSELSNKIYEKYLSLDFIFHSKNDKSKLIKNLQVEISYFTTYLQALIHISVETAVLVSILLTLIILQPLATISLAFFIGVPTAIIYSISKFKIKYYSKHRNECETELFQTLEDTFNIIDEIKIFDRKPFFVNKYSKVNNLRAKYSANYLTISQLPRLYLELITVFGISSLIILMLYINSDIANIISILTIFVAGIFRLIPSLNKIIASLQSIKYYSNTVKLFNSQLKLSLQENNQIKIDFKDNLKFNKIKFTYPSLKKPVFENLNYSINKGDIVTLIGESGKGKTTLVKLILGLIKPTEGTILVDNHDIKIVKRLITYVPQDTFLLSGSLLFNITLKDFTTESELIEINKIIRLLQLETFIDSLKDGLNTKIGSLGIALSGGQKKRIGIARALFFNYEIFIFDEITSGLDQDTGVKVIKNILDYLDQKTIIFISHDETTISFSNKIFEL